MSVFEDPKLLRSWFQRVKGGRTNVDAIRQLIADHALGSRNFTSTDVTVDLRQDTIFDSTAKHSQQLLAGYLAGSLTNPFTDYFELRTADPRIMREDEDARIWLEDTRNRMLRQQRDSRSGFLTQSAELYLDMPGFGMGAISVMGNRKERRIQWATHPLSQVSIQVNEARQVDTVFRELPLTARQWAQRFPKSATQEVSKALEAGNTESVFTAVQVLAPSDDPYAGQSPFRLPITSVYFTLSGEPMILESGGFPSMPLKTPRWSVEPGEVYGRGPGWVSLPNAMMLNQMVRTIITYAQKSSDPPLQAVNEAILEGIRTHPGGVTYIQQLFGMGGDSLAIRPLPLNPNHGLTVDLLNRVQLDVRNAYYAQILQLFTDSNMSATQVIELAKQVQNLLAPVLGRTQAEWVEPMLDRQLEIGARMGLYLPVPTALRNVEVFPVFQSPVARAARAAEGRSVLETVQAAAAVAEALQNPSVMDAFDPDAVVRAIHESLGAPNRILRSSEDVDAARQSREEQAAQQQQMEQLGAGAEIAQRLASAQQSIAMAA